MNRRSHMRALVNNAAMPTVSKPARSHEFDADGNEIVDVSSFAVKGRMDSAIANVPERRDV